MSTRIPLGSTQVAACQIYVCDPALECTACELDGDTLVVYDTWAAWNAVIDGTNSADDDVERGVGPGDLRRALSALSLRLSKLYQSENAHPNGGKP